MVIVSSPNVEGMTAIAGWMIVCMIFVFGALLGYAWLLWKKKKSCLKRKRSKKLSDADGKAKTKKKEEYQSKVDDIFLVAFPFLFLVFNVIYWPFCLQGHEDALPGWPVSGVISENLSNESVNYGPFSPGLPLERYSSQWTKDLAQTLVEKDRNMKQACHSSRNDDYLGESFQTPLFGYTQPESDYDFQCIFNTFVW